MWQECITYLYLGIQERSRKDEDKEEYVEKFKTGSIQSPSIQISYTPMWAACASGYIQCAIEGLSGFVYVTARINS